MGVVPVAGDVVFGISLRATVTVRYFRILKLPILTFTVSAERPSFALSQR
jgi:hypothetical protein